MKMVGAIIREMDRDFLNQIEEARRAYGEKPVALEMVKLLLRFANLDELREIKHCGLCGKVLPVKNSAKKLPVKEGAKKHVRRI